MFGMNVMKKRGRKFVMYWISALDVRMKHFYYRFKCDVIEHLVIMPAEINPITHIIQLENLKHRFQNIY